MPNATGARAARYSTYEYILQPGPAGVIARGYRRLLEAMADGTALDADGTAEAVRLSAANKKSSGHELVSHLHHHHHHHARTDALAAQAGSLAQLIASCARRLV